MTSPTISIAGFPATDDRPLPRLWLALLLFPLGYVATRALFPELEYASLNMLGALAMALLLARMRGNLVADLSGLIILFVFVFGYYLKFYAAEWIVSTGALWAFDPSIEDAARDHANALDTFRMLTYGFVASALAWSFAVRPAGLPKMLSTDDGSSAEGKWLVKWTFKRVTIALVIFMVVSAAAQFITGVGVMGTENAVLPYHMAGVIFHPREKTLPLILAFLAWISWVYRLPRWGMAALLMLVAHALVQSFLQASRGQLFYAFLPILALWLVRREFTRQRVLAFGAVLGLAALLHPLITALRILRVLGESLTLETLLRARGAMDLVVGDQGLNIVVAGIVSVVGRVSGTDTLLICTASPYPSYLSLDAIQHFLFNPAGTHARIMTQEIGGFAAETMTIAPTLVGTGVVLGGAMGVVVVCVLWTWFITALLDFIATRRWRVTQLAWAFVATWAFIETSALTALSNVYYEIFWGGGLVLCEWMMRRFVPIDVEETGGGVVV